MQNLHSKNFGEWFKEHISDVRNLHEHVDEEICWISRGPSFLVKSYRGYILNGVKFETSAQSVSRRTQNNGVCLSAITSTWTSVNDNHSSDLSYHGVVEKVYEVTYGHSLKIPMFQCKWFGGLKVDEFGLMSVKTTQLRHANDPFIMAEQANQCFYVTDPIESSMSYVLKRPPRDIYDMNDDENVM